MYRNRRLSMFLACFHTDACELPGEATLLRQLEEGNVTRCVFARSYAVSCRNQLYPPPPPVPPRIAHYTHEASACSVVVKVRGRNAAFCQRDHGIERPRRGLAADDGRRSHVVRIPASQSLRDWFAARYSGFVLLDAYSIRDRVPRQTFPFPLAPISPLSYSFPPSPQARLIRSLPKSLPPH